MRRLTMIAVFALAACADATAPATIPVAPTARSYAGAWVLERSTESPVSCFVPPGTECHASQTFLGIDYPYQRKHGRLTVAIGSPIDTLSTYAGPSGTGLKVSASISATGADSVTYFNDTTEHLDTGVGKIEIYASSADDTATISVNATAGDSVAMVRLIFPVRRRGVSILYTMDFTANAHAGTLKSGDWLLHR